MENQISGGIAKKPIIQVSSNIFLEKEESIIVEAPLEIRLSDIKHPQASSLQLAITMRTPGSDELLIKGFLFSEGIISGASDIHNIKKIDDNVLEVLLSQKSTFDITQIKRRLMMSSSCGICGKKNLDAVGFESRRLSWRSKVLTTTNVLLSLPQIMRRNQLLFIKTGALHASALFSVEGELLDLHEDVGRHNAMDKLVGSNLSKDVSKSIALVSGRTSYEICQKVAMLGIPILASIGPPSSMTIEVAEQEGITLIGFIKDAGFNIYCGNERIQM